ncbi:MAG: hypothetical protein ABJB03_07365 [Rhodoglobus sp.]
MVLSTRRSRLLGLGSLGLGVVGAVGMLAVAAPAGAAPTQLDIPVVVVHTTNENFSNGSYPGWAPEGPATFPSIVAANQDTSYVVQSYQPDLSKVPVGCSAKLLSFRVDVEALQILQGQTAQIGYFVGTPAKAVAGTTQSFEGTAIVDPDPGGFFHLYQVGSGLDGTLTITLPSPITPDAVPFGWVGLDLDGPARGPLWQINSASYQADITCPEQEQEQGQGQEQSLAVTGPASVAPIGAAGFVLAGVGAVLIARSRRTPER